ncbi:MAG TPA: amino acid permease [Thermodesulfobacteriota bacterium]|nr:amino acid permease [Thermodesulfobacteriota bacterium]
MRFPILDKTLSSNVEKTSEKSQGRSNFQTEGQRVIDGRSGPKQTIAVTDAIALIIGVVIGIGIFKTPSMVAANTGGEDIFILAWLAGGIISVIGGLCYAELATAYPHTGGDYHYLTRAFGRKVGFLFVWSRMTVIQPGSIAMLAFVFGDYLSTVLPFGRSAHSVYAVLSVVVLTILNLMGVQKGKWTQNLLTAIKVVGLFAVVLVGMVATASPSPMAPAPSHSGASFGLAMVFVLLTFGGWNEAAYISAELHEVRRNMVRALLWGVGIITVIYLLVNLAYMRGLGLKEMGQSEVVAADLMRRILGEGGAKFISLLIVVSALGAINACIFTGARTNYALGQDFSLFGFLGKWRERSDTPANALLFLGAVSVMWVLLGTLARKGFVAMVEYTAPVFWSFFLLVGLSLFVLRLREPEISRPFRVPFYPFTPLFFCITCVYMLHSSLVYVGGGALVGLAVLAAGALLLLVKPHYPKERGG